MLDEVQFDRDLIVDNTENPYRVQCSLKVKVKFTEHHVPPCTSASLGAPEYRQDGRYSVKVSEAKGTTLVTMALISLEHFANLPM